MTTDRAHAILAPSFMHVALKCSAAVGMKESIPEGIPTEYSIKGTRIHHLSGKVLNDFLEHKLTGSDPDIHLHEEINNDDKDIALQWRSFIWEKAFEGSVTGKVYGIEDKLTLSERICLWGTADFWLVSTDERAKPYGLVADLKSGFVFVDADENPQLAGYACALRQEVRAMGKDLDYVRSAIFQPFAAGEKWREVRFTSKQLDVWEKRFFKLGEAVYAGKTKFKVGEHCKSCPGIARCETHTKFLEKQTSLTLVKPAEIVFPEVPALSDETLVNINKLSSHIAKFLEVCKKELLEKLLRGEKIEGVKLVEANTKRKWDKDRLSELQEKLKALGIELFEPFPKGLTAVKDEMGALLGKKGADTFIDEYLIKPRGGITLVDSTDPRAEVNVLSGLFIEE